MPFSRRRIQFIVWESIGEYGWVKIPQTGLSPPSRPGSEPVGDMTVFGILRRRFMNIRNENLVIIGGQMRGKSGGEIRYPGPPSPTEIPGKESFPARSDNHVLRKCSQVSSQNAFFCAHFTSDERSFRTSQIWARLDGRSHPGSNYGRSK